MNQVKEKHLRSCGRGVYVSPQGSCCRLLYGSPVFFLKLDVSLKNDSILATLLPNLWQIAKDIVGMLPTTFDATKLISFLVDICSVCLHFTHHYFLVSAR